jgi:hypothetical protein
MNVKQLTDALLGEVKPADRENANIEIYFGDQQFEIESMSGFSLSPDIIIHLKEATTPILKPALFKKEHEKMVKKKVKEIKKDLVKESKGKLVTCPYCKGHSAKHSSTCEDCGGAGYVIK